MKFKDKIIRFFGTVGAAVKSAFLIAKGFVLSHKKVSLIVAVLVVIFAVILAVAFSSSKPENQVANSSSNVSVNNSSQSNSSTDSSSDVSSEPLTESQIEEIGDWWEEYIQGNNIVVEGNTPIDE